ncbi:hypothetical protein ACFYO0_45715 [Streptomyces sp. NPDC006365]
MNMPLRPVFHPLTLVMLLGTLVWGAARLARQADRPSVARDR